MADRELVSIDASTNDNGFLDGMRGRHPGALSHTSKKDLVDKLLGALGPNDCIKKLTIVGHGGPGHIHVGAGTSARPCQTINGGGDWKPELDRLRSKLCAGATIELFSCKTGAEQGGANKVHEIAQHLGVTVRAHTGYVYHDGTVQEGDRVQEATPERKPDPLPVPPKPSGLPDIW